MNFKAQLELHGKTATGIEVPPALMERLGGAKRPAVLIQLAGYSYRTTIGVMGGKFFIPVSSEHRAAAGLNAGDTVAVQLTLDEAPREVEVPDDFAKAMNSAKVRAAFDALAYSKRKEHVRSIESTKTDETRQRRLVKAIETLTAS